MRKIDSLRLSAGAALLSSLLLLGCGSSDVSSLLVSAKEYIAKNDNKAAIIQLKNVLQDAPNNAEARYLLGKSLLNSGDPVNASIELRKAKEANFDQKLVIPLLAQCELMQGKSKEVIEEFGNMQLQDHDAQASLLVTVGRAFLASNQLDAGLKYFNSALALSPNHPLALVELARIKIVERDYAAAVKLADQAMMKDGSAIEPLLIKGDVSNIEAKKEEALAFYHQALKLQPASIVALSAVILTELQLNHADKAAGVLADMEKLAPKHPQTYYLAATVAYHQKNFKVAKDKIQQHLRLLPDSLPGLQLAGAIEFELGSYPLAEANLTRVISKAPGLVVARRLLVATYLKSNQPQKALATIEPLLTQQGELNSEMLSLVGEVFMRNGEVEKASDYFAKALKLDPSNKGKQTSIAITKLAKGDIASGMHDLETIAATDSGTRADLALIAAQIKERLFDAALRSISTLEKKIPNDPIVPSLRGNVYLAQGRVDDAKRAFESALSKNAAYLPAATALARLDLMAGKAEAAKERFESVLKKEPKNLRALLALAELRVQTGAKTSEVVDILNRAVSAEPNAPAPYIALMKLYMAAHDVKSAEAVSQQAIASVPESTEVLDLAGQVKAANGEDNQAMSMFSKMASLAPKSPLPYLRMAEVQLKEKNRTGARENLLKALSVRDDTIEALRALIMLDYEDGNFDKALTRTKSVQKKFPKSPIGYLLEGDLYALRKSWQQAIAVYKGALNIAPDTDLAIKLHAAYLEDSNTSEAAKFAHSWVKTYPKDFKFLSYVGQLAISKNDFATANRVFTSLVDANPKNAGLVNNLAWVRHKLGDIKAIDLAEQANKLAPNQPAILDTLGTIYLDKGNFSKALELTSEAARLAPQNPLIRFNFAKALIKNGKNSDAKAILLELNKLGDKFTAQSEVSALLKSM